tara:strand:+ start:213 stop:692 length:480 start_codon:yes stop_codon:yes gene_type:complete
MKVYFISLIAILFCFQINGQGKFHSEQYKVSFESSQNLEKYDTESDSILGYENDFMAVDIEIFPLEEESPEFIADLKHGAIEISNYMEFENIQDGGPLPNMQEGYYVLAYSREGDALIPVYVVVMINRKLNLAYEVTVYCYNFDKIEGKKISKSFRMDK